MNDPFREGMLAAGADLPERLRRSAPSLHGEPAFDPAWIALRADDLRLPARARFEHPLLERAVRVGLAHIDATFQGDHARYGVGAYAEAIHDGFPPTIVAAVDALTLWGYADRAGSLFGHWLARFVRPDGSINYYGTSLAECGQLLATGRLLFDRDGGVPHPVEVRAALGRIAGRLRALLREGGRIALAAGVPEADTRDEPGVYFHNNAWMARGLWDWAAFAEDDGAESDARALAALLVPAIREVWGPESGARWLRPTVDPGPPDGTPAAGVTGTAFGSYTNYRYWPELLSSGVLPDDFARQVVTARLGLGGQWLGMTRFDDHLDDWPLADYLAGLWRLGMREDYRYCLWGHVLFHQAADHLTAYEQVTFPPSRPAADYCLPCQLVAPRAAARLCLPGFA